MANISVNQHDAVRLITLDDGKANALSVELIADIDSAIGDAEADAATRAVVLAGRDGRFSGGFDLEVMRSADAAAIVTTVADGGDLVRHLYGAEVPVVAACTGHAIAAGALLLLGCDVRIGADAPLKIGLTEVAIGMVLPAWAMTIASVRLSRRHAERSIMNARVYEGSQAVDAGFLDDVVEPDRVIERAISEAVTLATLDPDAYRRSVAQFRGATLATMASQIDADRAAV